MPAKKKSQPVAAESQPAANVVPMSQFFTRQKANAGRRLPLVLPDGTNTGEWIHVQGIDSDAFQKAQANMQRDAMHLAELDNEEEKFAALLEGKVKMVATLVTDWSFPEPCTFENVSLFLREAPQVLTAIDRIASNRRLFYMG